PSRAPQSRYQQPARGFDRDRNRVFRAVARVGEQIGQCAESSQVVADAFLGHQLAIAIDDRDVVMPFGPVDSAGSVHFSHTSVMSGKYQWSKTPARTRSTLLTSLSGLPPMSCPRSQRT